MSSPPPIDANELLEIMFSDVKPRTVKLTGLRGTSMYPEIVYGDRIYLDYEVTEKNLNNGDIVVAKYEPWKKIYLHRYYKGANRTKGDALIYFDGSDFEVLSRVEKVVPGRLNSFHRFKHRAFGWIPKEIKFALDVLSSNPVLTADNIFIEDLDFDYLFNWLDRNELIPFFVSKVTDWNVVPEKINDAFCEKLKKGMMKSQNLLLAMNRALLFMKQYFRDLKIDAVFFKGADLLERYYDDPLQRPMCDIDVMIQKKDLERLIVLVESDPRFEIRDKAYSLRHRMHVTVYYGGLPVEIHFRHFLFKYSDDFEKDRREGVIYKKDSELRYSNEANLCITSVSMVAHFESAFKLLLDAYLIIKKSDMDFEKLQRVSEALGTEKRLQRMLTLLKFYFPDLMDIEGFESTVKYSFSEKIWIALFKSASINLKRRSFINNLIMRYFLFENVMQYAIYMTGVFLERMERVLKIKIRHLSPF